MTFQFFTKKTKWLTALFIAAVLFFPIFAHAGIEEHITKTESGFYYTVQKGDTLWDLSQKFADSPWQWPNLWHYNPNIKNPHLIYPGQKILIYKKSWSETTQKPAETVVKPEPQPAEVKQFITYSKINSAGFIRKGPVTPCGTLLKSFGDKVLISDDDMVYIHQNPSGCTLTKGAHYTIYRTIGPVIDSATGDEIGMQYYLTGVVKITSIESGYAIGQVNESYRAIHQNDMLMPFPNRSENILIEKSVPGLSGKIIKGEDEHRVLLGENQVVFINKGEADGVKPGQQYSIYREQQKESGPDGSAIALAPVEIGRMTVLLTEEHTATVLITNSTMTIKSGMLVGPIPAQ